MDLAPIGAGKQVDSQSRSSRGAGSSVGPKSHHFLSEDETHAYAAGEKRRLILEQLPALLNEALAPVAKEVAEELNREFRAEFDWALGAPAERHDKTAINFARKVGLTTLKVLRQHLQDQPRIDTLANSITDVILDIDSDLDAGAREIIETPKPKHINYLPNDPGHASIPSHVSVFCHPQPFSVVGNAMLAGMANFVEGISSSSDTIKFPAAAILGHELSMKAGMDLFPWGQGYITGVAATGVVALRDIHNGAIPAFRRLTGHNFKAELLKPNSEVLKARRSLGRKYGINWVKDFEKWARTPGSISLDSAAQIAKAVMLSDNPITSYPLSSSDKKRLIGTASFLKFKLSDDEIKAVSGLTIVTDVSPTEAIKKLYTLCVTEPDPLKIKGHIWRLTRGIVQDQSKNIGFWCSWTNGPGAECLDSVPEMPERLPAAAKLENAAAQSPVLSLPPVESRTLGLGKTTSQGQALQPKVELTHRTPQSKSQAS